MADDLSSLDAAIRHQIYLEGYKNSQTTEMDTTLIEISVLVGLLYNRATDTMETLPKGKFYAILAEISRRITKLLNSFGSKLSANMKAFLRVELGTIKHIYQPFTKRAANTKAVSRYWADYLNEINPAFGQEPKHVFKTFFRSVLVDVQKTIKIAYASKTPIKDLVASIVGTQANHFKDGLANKLRNQFSTVIQTFIQQLSAFVMFEIGRQLTERYQWVSVIDGVTTHICRGRNGNIYLYATGPRPPAHYNCRSTIRPVFELASNDNNMPTYYTWLSTQPRTVQDDVLGRRRGAALRKGELKAEDLPKYDGTKTLTLEEYEAKRKNMLTAS